MAKKSIYREVRYIVGFDATDSYGDVLFFPMIQLDGCKASRLDSFSCWTASSDDTREMSLAYGAAQAECDQLNAKLEAKGLNRLREVS